MEYYSLFSVRRSICPAYPLFVLGRSLSSQRSLCRHISPLDKCAALYWCWWFCKVCEWASCSSIFYWLVLVGCLFTFSLTSAIHELYAKISNHYSLGSSQSVRTFQRSRDLNYNTRDEGRWEYTKRWSMYMESLAGPPPSPALPLSTQIIVLHAYAALGYSERVWSNTLDFSMLWQKP